MIKKILIILILFLIGAFFVYKFAGEFVMEKFLTSEFVQEQVVKQIDVQNQDLFSLLPEFIGFFEPKTYLLLFLNNTEMRPSGGFIGSYAVVTVDKGKVEFEVMEGTESLDRSAPDNWKIEPPLPIKSHLGVDRWYFRDSNWSPDFGLSSEKALEFYRAEGGKKAEEIDMVVGITTDVLEDLLRMIGPVTVDGITFTDENVIEKLEYEVEYGFQQRGIKFENRKDIMKPFFVNIMNSVKGDIFINPKQYFSLLSDLADKKHVLFFPLDKELHQEFENRNWLGQIKNFEEDYLLWVDANLAALKTDHAIVRDLNYQLKKQDDEYIAEAKMIYQHKGQFDWRTSRYLTYSRIFVPAGSELIEVKFKINGVDKIAKEIESGNELNKTWFGAFISIEPGQVGELIFVYKLPGKIKSVIEKNNYNLLVQKQAGTQNYGLTLDLNFAKNITVALPPEEEKNWHDTSYKLLTDLSLDREFNIKF